MSSRVIFCGNLPGDIRTREVEDLFYKFGRIIEVDLKTPSRPPAFAFVEFDDPRDAYEAVRGRDGYDFAGGRLRVELAKGGSRRGGGGYGGGYGGGISRRSKYRVMVTGLPKQCSWQDLKDFMRKAGDVTFSNVYRDKDGMMGIVDFAFKEDMEYAIRKLDDTEFERGVYVRVREDNSSRSPRRGRSRSRDRSLSKSRSRSPARSKSRSPARSKSRSPARSKSRSPARSMSRSPAASKSRSPSREKERSPSRSRSPAKSVSPARSD